MSAYSQILYHIVFRTKNSKKTIPLENSSLLYAYIWGIIKNRKENGIDLDEKWFWQDE
ncbi:hypothetical protein FACS1894177_09810 [Bacteroidia bacterium]|nr:hypothetical protein FACS1894177_09810 [Bacteroidia bacterium]